MTFVVATLAFFNLNSRFGFCGFWLIDDSRFQEPHVEIFNSQSNPQIALSCEFPLLEMIAELSDRQCPRTHPNLL